MEHNQQVQDLYKELKQLTEKLSETGMIALSSRDRKKYNNKIRDKEKQLSNLLINKGMRDLEDNYEEEKGEALNPTQDEEATDHTDTKKVESAAEIAEYNRGLRLTISIFLGPYL